MNHHQGSFLLVAILACGCHSENAVPLAKSESRSSSTESNSSPDWGGLLMQGAGARLEQASQAVILLHGYGAAGGDLVPLANIIGDGKSIAFLFPQAPIRLEQNSFAWSVGNGSDFEQSRQQVISIINQIHTQYPGCQVSVGGFSQGATLACNLLSEPDLKIESVILYSPKNHLWHEPVLAGHQPKVFFSHGRSDSILPFSEAEQLKNVLEQQGYRVDWQPFDGRHELTYELLEATRKFLSELPKTTDQEQAP